MNYRDLKKRGGGVVGLEEFELYNLYANGTLLGVKSSNANTFLSFFFLLLLSLTYGDLMPGGGGGGGFVVGQKGFETSEMLLKDFPIFP